MDQEATAFGLVTTFLLALLIELLPRHQQAAPVMAWYTAAISTGYAIGALLGAQSIEWLGHPGAFVASGLIGLALLALYYVVWFAQWARAASGRGRGWFHRRYPT